MNLTSFQINTIDSIERLPGFKTFIKTDGQDLRELHKPDRIPGPIHVLWYHANGRLHSWTVDLHEVTLNVMAEPTINTFDRDDAWADEQLEESE